MHKKNFFMAGMPGSGKTAYIGATWIMLSEGDVPTIYTKQPGHLPKDYSELEKIANSILEYKDLERTKEEEKVKLDLILNDKQGNEVYLNIPDLAGEIFRDLVKDRRISKEIVEKLLEADCILFFIYYKNMSKERRIQVSDNDDIEEKKESTSENKSAYVDDKREANESEVVDLLLSLLELLESSQKIVDIRFVLSAWDMVEHEYGTDILPELFMEQNFPLLYQCINCNQDRINAEFWGVSALGGDLNNSEDIKRLQSEEKEAIRVVSPDGNKSNDLTAVLAGIGDEK